MNRKYFIFDLDDTLVYELDYLKSAYQEIASSIGVNGFYDKMVALYNDGQDVFEMIEKKHKISKKILLQSYREHFPTLFLKEDAAEIIRKIKKEGHLLGLITDGRSITQRNKIEALGIGSFFDKIIISEEIGSEKPSLQNFEVFITSDIKSYYYVGDNVKKDFVTPNKIGWTTVCLRDKGFNIHPQSFEYPLTHLPAHTIGNLLELTQFLYDKQKL